jgi:Fe-S cluster assembly iron-binding protein IscA/pimeloyl-ACP methyl ester carboxylesterase
MTDYRRLILAAIVIAGCNPGPPSAAEPPTGADPKPAVIPKQETPNRPRGDRVVLTDRAAKQIRKIMMETPEAKYLRVTASDDRLKLDLDSHTDPKEDVLNESRGVSVVVDRKSAAILPVGIVVDYLDEGGTKGFKFASPGGDQDQPDTSVLLADARRGFKTTLRPRKEKAPKTLVPDPPGELFGVVRYDAPPGKLAAYLTPDPKDGKKHPAIVWITGGDCNSIDEGCWRDAGALGDQSASAYRKAGIVMMFPSLRGGNDNPGTKEGFLGEVDDVLAAAAFLRKQPYVDPDRVYLGGHSTGGTLALLTAECSDSFRAVFSFGPTDDVLGYGLGGNPFSLTDPKEFRLRSPAQWLHSVRSPVFVIEGAGGGNAGALRSMARKARNPKVRFFVVKAANHFTVLGPTNRLIADKILRDTKPACGLTFTEEEINKPFLK